MKVLLYCNKKKPYLSVEYQQPSMFEPIGSWNVFTANKKNECGKIVNGKTVAEIECDIEEIKFIHVHKGGHYTWYEYKGVNITDPDCERDICKESCMDFDDFFDVSRNNRTGLPGDCKAYMIKGMRILDEPIGDYKFDEGDFERFKKMAKEEFGITIVKTEKGKGMKATDIFPEFKALPKTIRCSSEELCRILNGEQTIIVRKK